MGKNGNELENDLPWSSGGKDPEDRALPHPRYPILTTPALRPHIMAFPDFRKIFHDFRSATEERFLALSALAKFATFSVLVVALIFGRGSLLLQ